MKKSELVKIIRTAVKQELTESLPKMITKILLESNVVAKDDPVELVKEVLKTKSVVSLPKSKTKQKRYSNNEALNQVLNETVGGIPTEGSRVGDGAPATDLHGQPVDIDSLPDHVSKALTRNYSDVLKLVDKKRGNGS
jgi:hypothetical protein